VAGALNRAFLRAIVWLNAHAKSAAIRLTKLTGKSHTLIHPKHLLQNAKQHWCRPYIPQGARVLDVGCGNGVQALQVASQASAVVAIDRDLALLTIARALRSVRPAETVSFALADAEHSLPFADGEFDSVLLLDVIEHVERRLELLHEIHRVLRSGGRLLISAPNRNTSWKRRLRKAQLPSQTDPDHRIEYSQGELLAELEAGGFRVQGDLLPIVYDTPWAGLFDLVGGISLTAYRPLMDWKRTAARRHPEETIGWRAVLARVG